MVCLGFNLHIFLSESLKSRKDPLENSWGCFMIRSFLAENFFFCYFFFKKYQWQRCWVLAALGLFRQEQRVPATILTGFLGAGKTTFLRPGEGGGKVSKREGAFVWLFFLCGMTQVLFCYINKCLSTLMMLILFFFGQGLWGVWRP